MSWYNDEELLGGIIDQTAAFRFGTPWSGGRLLLKERGIDPMRCLLLGCEQGDDVAGTLVLPDGEVVDFDMREDPRTRELIAIRNWRPVTWEERDIVIAREILSSPDLSSFDERVHRHYIEHYQDGDGPLPPR